MEVYDESNACMKKELCTGHGMLSATVLYAICHNMVVSPATNLGTYWTLTGSGAVGRHFGRTKTIPALQ